MINHTRFDAGREGIKNLFNPPGLMFLPDEKPLIMDSAFYKTILEKSIVIDLTEKDLKIVSQTYPFTK